MRSVAEIQLDIDMVERDPHAKTHCCCGDLVDHDPWEAGHQPISVYTYVMAPLNAEMDAAKANAT